MSEPDRATLQSPLTAPYRAVGILLLGVIIAAAGGAERQAEKSFRTIVARQRLQLSLIAQGNAARAQLQELAAKALEMMKAGLALALIEGIGLIPAYVEHRNLG